MANPPAASATQSLALLCLDGGGIRGLASLLILQRLMEMIDADHPLKPCDVFDMIGGTSTGGLIAVMLGRLRLSVQDAYNEYIRLSPSIFTKLQHRVNWKGKTQGRYNADALKEGVIDILTRNDVNLKPDELLKATVPGSCRTYEVNDFPINTVVFSSYYSRRRGTGMRDKAKIWECVRATAAASSFFDPITIDGLEFVDGGTGANNPLEELLTEARDAFKNGPEWRLEGHIKCLVSIGTGVPKFTKFDENVTGIIKTLTSIATDTEKVWENFYRGHTDMVQELRAFRFNVDKGLQDIELDETKSIPDIRAETDQYLTTENVLSKIEACGQNLAQRESMFRLHAQSRVCYVMSVCSQEAVEYVTCSFPVELSLTNTGGARLGPVRFAGLTVTEWIEEIVATFEVEAEEILAWLKNLNSFRLWMEPEECGSFPPRILLYEAPHEFEKELRRGRILGLILFQTLIHNGNLAVYLRRHDDLVYSSPPEFNTSHQLTCSCLGQLLSLAISRHAELERHKLEHLISKLLSGVVSWAEALTSLSDTIATTRQQIFVIAPVDDIADISTTREVQEEVRDFIQSFSAYTGFIKLFIVTKDSRDFTDLGVRSLVIDNFLSELSFEDVDFYRERIPRAEAGTNVWLWDHPTLRDWRHMSSGILWIQGKPGSGKSVLARTIIERGRSLQSGHDLRAEKLWISAVRWIYSRRFESRYTKHTYMLRSLIKQILELNKNAFHHIKHMWRQERDALLEDSSKLKTMLRMLAENLLNVQLIVIDGLDEGVLSPCEGGQTFPGRTEILNFIGELVLGCENFKFLILSRPEPDILEYLGDHPLCYTIVLQNENKADIERLVDARLSELQTKLSRSKWSTRLGKIAQTSGLRPSNARKPVTKIPIVASGQMALYGGESRSELLLRVRNYVSEAAEGVFLWVTLVFQELDSLVRSGLVSWAEIERALRSLPTDIVSMYQSFVSDLVERHQSNTMQLAKARRALEWLYVASYEEHAFSLEALRDALSIPPETSILSQSDRDPFADTRSIDDTWYDYRWSLYRLCGPFIDVVRPTNENPEDFGPYDQVQFVHTTAKDFLTSELAGVFCVDAGAAADRISLEAQRYLDLSFPQQPKTYYPLSRSSMREWENTAQAMLEYLAQKPLLAYSSKHLLKQTQLQDAIGMILTQPAESFSESTSIMEYGKPFYGSKSIAIGRMLTAIGKITCDGCIQGLITAIHNILALVQVASIYQNDLRYCVLRGALAAAIIEDDSLLVARLATAEVLFPGSGTLDSNVNEWLTSPRYSFNEQGHLARRFNYWIKIQQERLQHSGEHEQAEKTSSFKQFKQHLFLRQGTPVQGLSSNGSEDASLSTISTSLKEFLGSGILQPPTEPLPVEIEHIVPALAYVKLAARSNMNVFRTLYSQLPHAPNDGVSQEHFDGLHASFLEFWRQDILRHGAHPFSCLKRPPRRTKNESVGKCIDIVVKSLLRSRLSELMERLRLLTRIVGIFMLIWRETRKQRQKQVKYAEATLTPRLRELMARLKCWTRIIGTLMLLWGQTRVRAPRSQLGMRSNDVSVTGSRQDTQASVEQRMANQVGLPVCKGKSQRRPAFWKKIKDLTEHRKHE